MYYYPISDLAIIPLTNGKVLFKSDNLAIKIDGKSTSFLVDKIFPLLDGINTIDTIATQVDISKTELESHLNNLVQAGILLKKMHSKVPLEDTQTSPIFENLLDSLGFSSREVSKYLKDKTITIIGLDSIGYILMEILIQFGVTNFQIADCLPTKKNDRHLLNFVESQDIGRSRQEVIKKELLRLYPNLTLDLIPELTKENIRKFVKNSDLVIGCYDKSYVVSNYWINEIAFELGVPSLYTEIQGQKCFIGPLVIPEKTGCYMCYKMRSIACVDDYEAAMSHEEYLNPLKKSDFFKRNFFPSNIYLSASLVANETIKFLLSLDLTSIKGKIIEFDVFNLSHATHTILFKPDCPVCRKKKEWKRKHYNATQLIQFNRIEGDLSSYENTLISPHTGIIKFYDLFKKDISEPHLPFIYRTDLANHNFISDLEPGNNICSGKGLTLAQAKISALGEAVERYSGAIYNSKEITYLSYNEINSRKLHPKYLVLFEESQYPELNYSRFDEHSTLGWVEAYSLSYENKISVPAISIFMDYKISAASEHLFPITSNGLGAGATLLQAILSASLEVIERDAFIITWHQKLDCQRFDPFTLPMSDVVNYCKMYARRGVELSLYKIPSDFPCHVFLAIAHQVEGNGPAIVVGLGADFDPLKAAKGALIEVGQVRPALKKRMRQKETQKRLEELLDNPNNVKELADHDLLYASPNSTHHFDFLLDLKPQQFDLKKNTLSKEEELDLLLKHTKKINSELIYYNLTSPEMEALHLFTARVIIPELQPIHFGTNQIRLAGKRLYELPISLKLKKQKNSYTTIDMQPHPLA